jgi:hypothetical protein
MNNYLFINLASEESTRYDRYNRDNIHFLPSINMKTFEVDRHCGTVHQTKYLITKLFYIRFFKGRTATFGEQRLQRFGQGQKCWNDDGWCRNCRAER